MTLLISHFNLVLWFMKELSKLLRLNFITEKNKFSDPYHYACSVICLYSDSVVQSITGIKSLSTIALFCNFKLKWAFLVGFSFFFSKVSNKMLVFTWERGSWVYSYLLNWSQGPYIDLLGNIFIFENHCNMCYKNNLKSTYIIDVNISFGTL